ncbi:MAG: hypothetical protein HKN91_09645 [Acidimicrobiia bacterium]|nr:hypothetical protein [Acidimicrobiia bacterium]
MRLFAAVTILSTFFAGCTTGPVELQEGDCVDIVGTGSSEATERLVTVDCDTVDTDGVFEVVWIEDAADSDPLTVTLLAAQCEGPTLLPDADMLEAGDRSVVCFQSLD